MRKPAPIPMVAEGLGILPLHVPDGFVPEAIEGDTAVFAPAGGEGRPHLVELPFAQGSYCKVRTMNLDLPNGDLARLPIIDVCVGPDQAADHVIDLGIEGGANTWWLTVRVEPGRE